MIKIYILQTPESCNSQNASTQNLNNDNNTVIHSKLDYLLEKLYTKQGLVYLDE